MAPTPRTGLILLGIGLVPLLSLFGVPVPTPLVLAAFGAVVAAAIVDADQSRRHPDAVHHMDEVVSRGVPASITVELNGPAARRARVRQPSAPDMVVTPPIGRRGLEAELVARRRGRHVLPGPVIRVQGPLGLAMTTRQIAEPTEVDVYPDLPAARRIAASVRTGLFRTEGLRTRGPLGLGTEFEALRDYVEGDDIRQVNWLATARMQRPMVNEFRTDQDRDVICLIDAGRLMSAPLGRLTRMDAAVDAAAAIAAVSQVLGDRVGVVAFDDAIRVDLPPRRRGAEAVARAIFDLEPRPVDADYRAAFEKVAGMKRAFVLVLTDVLDPAAVRPLVDAIPILGRQHAVAVASVVDPDVAEAVTEIPEHRRDVARAAAAVTMLANRAEALALVRRRAAQVIERPPESFSAGCVSAYLRAKAAARI